MATEIKRLRPESIRTTGALANDVLVVSGGQTAFVNELFVSGLNIGTSSSIAGAKLQVVGDIEISGSIFQSGDLFTASDTGLAVDLGTTGQSLLADISTVSGLITSNDSEIAALQTATGSLQTQVTANDGDISTNAGNISTNASNLVITGQTLTTNINTVSGLITDNDAELNALRTATGSLQTQVTANDGDISTNAGNISTNTSNISTNTSNISTNTSNISTNTSNISTNSSNISTNASNLTTTGQTLQSQITSNDSDISTNAGNISTNTSNISTNTSNISTNTSNISTNSSNISTNASNLVVTGQTLQSQVDSNDIELSDLRTATGSLQTQVTSNDTDISVLQTATGVLDSTTVKTTTDQAIAGDKTFTDLVTINNLTVTGIETIVSTTNLNVKDNIVLINSGEAGAGISLVSGGLEIDRGSETNANILFNDSTDQFELNFPIATEGDLVATATNLASTGQTLQTQITSNDSDISSLTTNLVTTGQTLQTQITSNDGDISTLTSNLVTTGQTLTTDIGTVSGLVTSNDTELSDLRTATGSLQTQVTSNDSNISTLQTATGSLQAQVTANDGDISTNSSNISTNASNLVTTGQTLQTQIASNDSDISTLTSNLVSTGQILTTDVAIVSGLITSNDTELNDLRTATGVLKTTTDDTSGNLITTGQTLTTNIGIVSGLITNNDTELSALRTATGSLQTQITSNDSDISTNASSISTNASNISANAGNLVTTGQTLQTQITSNDSDISTLTTNLISTGQSVTSEIAIVSGLTTSNDTDIANLTTNLATTGQTLQTQVTSNDSDISTLTSNLATTDGNLITTGQTLQTQITSNDSDISTLDSTTVKLTSDQTIAGNKTFSDTVTVTDLNVTGTQTTISTTNLAIKDNLIEINSGETGTGISLISGGVTISRGSGESANILFNDSTDQFELNFPIATEGDLVATATNLITTGQTLQTQITSNDGDISTLTSNLSTTDSNLVTTGQTLQTQITSNDGDISTLTSNLSTTDSNLITTGQTLQTQITSNDSDISTLTTNLISTGTIVDDISGNLITTGQTLQTQITSNDSDISTITSNLITTGQTLTTDITTVSGLITNNDTELSDLRTATGNLQTQVTSNDGDILTLTTNLISTGSIVDDVSGNLITTGQTLQTQITSNDSDITTLTSNLITTGQTLTTDVATVSGLITSNDTELSDLRTATGILKTSTDTNTTNLVATGAVVDDISGNLITTGQTLQTQITSNDGDISSLTSNLVTTGQTLQTQITSNDSDISTLTTNLISTGQSVTSEIAIVSGLATSNLNSILNNDSDISANAVNISTLQTATGTLKTSVDANTANIASNDSDISTLQAATGSLQTQVTSNDTDITALQTATGTLNSTTVKTTTNQTVAGNKTFTDLVTINNLTVTGTETIVSTTNLNVKDNIILINSGEAGAGISLTSGGLEIDRGSEENANILFNDSSDRFETNFNLAIDGNLVVTADETGSFITTSDTGNHITSSQTGDFASDADISTLTTNLASTGLTLTTDINTVSGLVTTNAGDISTNASNISTNASNLVATGQTLQSQITSNDSDISTNASNISTNTSSISTLTTNLASTGSTLDAKIDTLSGIVALDSETGDHVTTSMTGGFATKTIHESFSQGLNVGTSATLGSRKLHVVGDIEISGTIFQSGSKFEGGGGGGGGAGGVGDLTSDVYTGDGITTGYALSIAPTGVNSVLVSVGGIIQTPTTNYTIAGSGLNFSSPPPTGTEIEIRNLNYAAGYVTTAVTNTLDAKIDTLSGVVALDSETGNHVTTSMTGSLIDTSMTGSFASDADITSLTTNLVTTGQTLQTQITSNDGDISSLTSNLVTTGQTLQTQITSNDSDISTLTTNVASTGSTLDAKIDTLSGAVVLDSETGAFGNMSPTSINSNLIPDGSGTRSLGSAANPWDDLFVSSGTINIGGKTISLTESGISFNSDISIDGTIFQSGAVFEGGGGGGGGGSSTFVGLSDTPGSFTANKYVRVNSAGNALEYTENVGGINTTDIFTGDGSASGFAISSTVTSTKDLLVSINGILQRPDTDYTLAGTTGLFFNTGVTSGYFIEARHIVGVSGAAGPSGAAGAAGPSGADGPAASGWATTDQGYFTGFDLAGTATGIVQNASGSVAGLDLADNKWDVNVIEEYDSLGDSSWSNTKLLLEFPSATSTETSTTDSSSSSHSITFGGNTKVDGTQSKFGGKSVYFDGSNDYLSIPDSSDWHISTNEFTIEFWWRYTALPSNTWNSFCSQRYQWNNDASFDFSYKTYGGANVLGLSINNGTVSATASWAPSINTWYHLAVCRDSSNIRFFVDGAQIGTNTANTTDISNSSQDLRLGSSNAGGSPTSSSNGYMDGFRFTNGTARYTADFTPPSAPHPDQAVETDVKYIGQVGGWDDADVDYGIKKLSSTELSVKKMSTDVPDRLYVNVQKLGAVGQGIAFNQIFTGDGTTTNYLLTDSVPNTQDLLVSVEGLIQTPNTDYTLAGNTGISFTTGVTSGNEISLRYLALGSSGADGAAGAAGPAGTGVGIAFDQIFTGDGTTTNYLLSSSAPNARDLLVVVEGMVQSPTIDYTLLGGTGVSFTTGVPSGQELSIRYLSMGPSGETGPSGAGGGVNYFQDIFTGNGVVSGFSMGRTVSNILETTVFVNGLAQISDVNYFVNGTGLTFTSGDIASGDLIMVRHIY